MEDKTEGQERKCAWDRYSETELSELEGLSGSYRHFLDASKTERECVSETERIAREAGYSDLRDAIAAGRRLSAGDRVYAKRMGKTILLFQLGSEPLEKGMNILGAHIDSPRLDVKQNPLYEENGLAYLDTHYYGGIKKYQWVTVPLAIHGVVARKDGSAVSVAIGEEESDPAFCVTDLLSHLSGDQMEKKARKVIEGEDLDILFGSRPMEGEGKERARAHALRILEERYGIGEEDFFSAELEAVPAGKAREAGLDRSMILGYGQDDRACAYACLSAILGAGPVRRTVCCILTDKEEIGSVGATGMRSHFFEDMVAETMELCGGYSELGLRRCLAASRMLSCDVSAAFDPLYSRAFEKRNSAFLGRGVAFNKYAGSRGKGGSNDANAEYLGAIRKILEDNGVAYQSAELGRVDQGGSGTIAYILSLYGMEVVDSGIPVLGMHAPWEVTSKADIYEARKCYAAFLRDA